MAADYLDEFTVSFGNSTNSLL